MGCTTKDEFADNMTMRQLAELIANIEASFGIGTSGGRG